MQRAIRVVVVSTGTAIMGLGLAASAAHAAPESPDEIVPIIDAEGPSSGVATTTIAPTTTMPAPAPAPPADEPLVTAEPLPVDPIPGDGDDTGDDDGVREFVIVGPAETPAPTTLAPTDDGSFVIDGPATVATSTVPAAPAMRNEVGGTVYFDYNRNGVDDGAAADPRAAGVGMFVIWDGADGRPGTADDRLYEASTDVNGDYRVTDLPDGGYTIAVNPAKMPANSTVTVDPDGGLADATTFVALAGGAVEHGHDFGLGTRPPDLGDAGVITDTAEGPQAVADVTGQPDPLDQQLPATGDAELAWAFTLATVFLIVGVALFGVRPRRDLR